MVLYKSLPMFHFVQDSQAKVWSGVNRDPWIRSSCFCFKKCSTIIVSHLSFHYTTYNFKIYEVFLLVSARYWAGPFLPFEVRRPTGLVLSLPRCRQKGRRKPKESAGGQHQGLGQPSSQNRVSFRQAATARKRRIFVCSQRMHKDGHWRGKNIFFLEYIFHIFSHWHILIILLYA